MKRFIFLLVLPCVLAFQANNHQKTTIVYGDNLEVINGSVRQLINSIASHSRIDRDTINFNKKGEIIDVKSLSGDKHYHIKYSYKYSSNGKPTEILTNSIGY